MKSAKITTVGLLTTALILGVSPSYAAPNTSFNVKIAVESSCAVGNVSDVDFGLISAAAAPTTDLKQTTSVSVTCNLGTPYNIVFKTSRGSTNGTGTMTNEGTTKIPYALFSDSGYSKPWGSVIGTNSVSGIASGSADLYTVYSKVALSDVANPALFEAGSYNDIVSVQIIY
ncbi:MAG: spore coat U domain-containing protein [Neisseriaceae bacterium]|nr:spore coat U domain-containing protein [Neisseriaceae bacterium]